MSSIEVDVLNIGRARNYDTAVALNSADLLGYLYGGGYVLHKWHGPLCLLPQLLRLNRLTRMCLRSAPELSDPQCVPIWKHLWLTLLPRGYRNQFFLQRSIFSQTAGILSRAPVIIAEQTEALEAFQLARQRGAKKVLMMTGQSPAGREYWLAEEHLRWPSAEQISMGSNDLERLVERELAEMRLADVLLSPSDFVTESIYLYPELRRKKIIQVNWPIWGNDVMVREHRSGPSGQPVHVLFVGEVGLLKGVMYLVQALQKFPANFYEARFVGGVALSDELLEQCRSVAEVMGHLSYPEMRAQYEWADVLVLPSLSEGRARVTVEAMAAGLPIIVTQNTGVPIEDGVNGILIPARDVDAIIEALRHLAADSHFYESMSRMAIETVRDLTIERYSSELLSVIDAL